MLCCASLRQKFFDTDISTTLSTHIMELERKIHILLEVCAKAVYTVERRVEFSHFSAE